MTTEDEYRLLMQNVVMQAPSGPILDMYAKAWTQVQAHDRIFAAISGGSDSRIMMHMLYHLDPEKKVTYGYFDTGMEYEATKRHLSELEELYGVEIQRIPPVLPIPTTCRKYGIPFWSKHVSECMYRLQKHGFQWEDEPFEVLLKRYPDCKSALMWWCDAKPKLKNGGLGALNISYTPWLKEFIIKNPPRFRISAKCCSKAKKEPAAKYIAANDFDLSVQGVRKAEKGVRSQTYTSCFTPNKNGAADEYRPLFWLTDADKQEYKDHYGLRYSDCYEVWGMTRTGCPGCPFGKNFDQELELMQQYEPKFYKAALNIFGPAYEYTREYLAYRAKRNQESKAERLREGEGDNAN